MDCLATHYVLADCFAKKVTFHIPSQLELCFEGSSGNNFIQLISVMKSQSLLKEGCPEYLAYVMRKDNDMKLDKIPIVRYCPDVFLEELLRLPQKREVEFIIELMLEMTLISKASYQMDPLELK